MLVRIDNKRPIKSPKNRIYPGAKLSEYMTMKIVECYVDDLNAQQAHVRLKGKVSVRTIYKVFKELAERVCFLMPENRDLFNGVGSVIAVGLVEDIFPETKVGAESRSLLIQKHRRLPKLYLNYMVERFIRRSTREIYPPDAMPRAWDFAKSTYKQYTGVDADERGVGGVTVWVTNVWAQVERKRRQEVVEYVPALPVGMRTHREYKVLWMRDIRRLLLRYPLGRVWAPASPVHFAST